MEPYNLENMNKLAHSVEGELVNHSELQPGDRFMIYMNQGTEVCSNVYVHDNFDGGCANVHYEQGGGKCMMTGEYPVIKLGVNPNE